MSTKPPLIIPANFATSVFKDHAKPEHTPCLLEEVAKALRVEFGVKDIKTCVRDAVARKSPIVHGTTPFTRALTVEDMGLMRSSILSRSLAVNPDLIRFIGSSPVAFTGDVSKDQFLISIIDAIQQPEVAGFYAHVSLALVYGELEPSDSRSEMLGKISNFIYEMGEKPSGQSFTQGDFASTPLTAEEIRAIPYATGYLPEAYDLVEHGLEKHSRAVARKLASAGMNLQAETVLRRTEEVPVTKRTRAHEDDSPSP